MIVPGSYFYCPTIATAYDLSLEWARQLTDKQQANSKVFNVCDYPFLLTVSDKRMLLQRHYVGQKQLQVRNCILFYLLQSFIVQRFYYSGYEIQSEISVSA